MPSQSQGQLQVSLPKDVLPLRGEPLQRWAFTESEESVMTATITTSQRNMLAERVHNSRLRELRGTERKEHTAAALAELRIIWRTR